MNNNNYLNIAQELANQSKATKLKVGCVLVKDDNFISFSYNGTPRGSDNTCEDENNKTYPEVIHAEAYAITKAARAGISTDKSTAYITHAPCMDCAKLLYQAGIINVVFREGYKTDDGVNFLQKHGVKVFYLPEWNKDTQLALL